MEQTCWELLNLYKDDFPHPFFYQQNIAQELVWEFMFHFFMA